MTSSSLFVTRTRSSFGWWPIEDRGTATLWGRQVQLPRGSRVVQFRVTGGEVTCSTFKPKVGIGQGLIFYHDRVPPSDAKHLRTSTTKHRAWRSWYAQAETLPERQPNEQQQH